ncbi:MAG: DUF5818 domain-containing protein [Desulfobacterales bacterium]
MKLLSISLMLVLIATLSLYGCSEEQGMTTGQTEQKGEMEQAQTEGQQPATSVDMARDETKTQAGTESGQQTGVAGTGEQFEVTGVVEQTADGYALRSVNESYAIEGDEDLSQMVGKDVRITGSLEESNGKRVINVEEVTVIE